jgi:hypothetical protein
MRPHPQGQSSSPLRLRRSARAAFAGLTVALVAGSAGCLNRPLEPVEPAITKTIMEPLKQSRVDKLDLLLMIDNSASMGDKQSILQGAVPDLVTELVNPPCVDGDGVVSSHPGGPLETCPAGTTREFQPVLDIHIGIISSSIGGHGADACVAGQGAAATVDDHGHLLSRMDVDGTSHVKTWNDKGFLAWDPGKKLDPAGETDLGDVTSGSGLLGKLGEMVGGVGQVGCGYEAQLESWYRFLVDPDPYAAISAKNLGAAQISAKLDDTLLRQRSDFLRPSSLLAIIMLTDENDCSIREGGNAYLAAEQYQPDHVHRYHPPRARHECEINVNDPCCTPCGQSGSGCPADPSCSAGLTDEEDPIDLRCYDQKRRFGLDLLYPIDRYTKALTSATVQNRQGEVVPNPIFTDLKPGDGDDDVRDSSLVFLAGIVGVPWQDIARQGPDGKPDLVSGLDKNGKPVGGFKDADELATRKGGVSAWDILLGDPQAGTPPIDPLMRESTKPRMGQNPITGDPLVAPEDGTSPTANPINGHEFTTTDYSNGNLEYACTFKLPSPEACTGFGCECKEGKDNPLCQADDGTYGQTVYRAKGYPGLRELGVLKGLGKQGIVGSVCPAQLAPADKPEHNQKDYGYRPAMGAIIERLKQTLSNECLPFPLTPDVKTGQVACLVIEASKSTNGACDCNKAGRHPIASENSGAIDATKGHGDFDCFCQIDQLKDAEADACRTDPRTQPAAGGKNADGWCYIDATAFPAVGNPDLVAGCPLTERREVRLVGKGRGEPGSTLFITCAD